MATIRATTQDVARGVLSSTWSGIASGDDFEPVSAPRHPEATVQATGTFGSATVTLEVSNDGLVFHPLDDFVGDPIAFTAAGYFILPRAPFRFLRPAIAGAGGSGITVTVLAKADE